MVDLLAKLNTEMADVAEGARRGLVRIQNRHGTGSGIICHPDGLIVTNAHVVARGPLQVVFPDGNTLNGKLLSRDTNRDLAALSVDATGLPVVPFGESKNLQPGEWVLAIGNPWGVQGAATAGVVIGSSRGRDLTPGDREWISVSLPLRPGHSGGPLLDAHGEVVGINTMMNGPEVGMAVPVHVVKAFLRETLGSADSHKVI